MPDILKLFKKIAAWSEATFGRGQKRTDPRPTLRHLEKEVKELLEQPFDLEEYADAALLLADALHISGYTLPELAEAVEVKFCINQARRWGAPGLGGVIEHLKEEK